MLISTLTMTGLIVLVFITIFSNCQTITVRDDDTYSVTPKDYTYSEPDFPGSEVEYRQEDYYKPLRRADVRTYQYRSDESNQQDYTQPQTEESENSFAERGQRQQARRRTPAKKTHVEQYLKEVTPTTKTVYNHRPENYLRLNSQSRDRAIKEQTEELQRSTLKQPSIQYVLQSDLQQKSQSHPQIQYVVGEQKPTQLQQNDVGHTASLASYQNALLAHQKVLETESQGATSRSSIYVTHSIPKKPIRKIVKPTDKDEDVERYTQLQQLELQQQIQPVYERQEPAAVAYQAKVDYSNRDTNFQTSTEVPSYQQDKIRQYVPRYQQVTTEEPLLQEEKFVYQNPHQVAAYQHILSSRPGRIPIPIPIKYNQQSASSETQFQNAEATLEYKTVTKSEENPALQYQQPYVKKGPKYLPEAKSLRYQPLNLGETAQQSYQQIVNIPGEQQEALRKYQAAIAKLQSEKLLKAREQRVRPQIIYQPVEQGPQATRYSHQQNPEESEEQEYVRIGDARYRSIANVPSAVSYSQSHQNANLRYYRNPGRPAVSYFHH